MKMVLAVVPKDEADRVIGELVANGLTATFVDSRGGVLRQASQMLFIVVEDHQLEQVLGLIGGSCRYDMEVTEPAGDAWDGPDAHRRTPQIGGAVVFVWALEGMQRY